MRWKLKNKKGQTGDSKVVAHTDKKARLRIGFRKSIIILVLASLVLGGLYWLYANDKLGPLSSSDEPTKQEPKPPGADAPPGESIEILSPDQIPDDIPYEDPKPAVSG